MFLPIGDDQEHERTPFVNYALIVANAAVFILFCFPHPRPSVMDGFALHPDRVMALQLLTSMFLHANLLHLLGNMLFLWIFGRIVEERIGHVGYAAYYLVCGVAAAFLHVFTTETPEIAVLGASGAVSGTLGGSFILCPQARIKVFVWYWVVNVFHIPAVLWIAAWVVEQVFFSVQGYGGVAYYAHLGGLVAGALIAWSARLVVGLLKGERSPPLEPKDSASLAEPRRPFVAIPEESEPVFLDSTVDRYAVVTLEDSAPRAERVAEVTAPIAGESAAAVASRLQATHGIVARAISRAKAEQIRRDLSAQGIAAALIADVEANHPPKPELAESASWDGRVLRLRLGDTIVPVPWSSPFLFLAGRLGDARFIDVFATRKSAFRVRQAPGVALTRVDVRNRNEESTDLSGLAADIAQYRGIGAGHPGPLTAAQRGGQEWLNFKSPTDYDDYVFWAYHLILSQAPLQRG